jgi:DNA polymerase-3 subunit delta'
MTAERALQLLSKCIRDGRLAQALIIIGDPRQDAARVAEGCAATLFCGSPSPPCGRCPACRHALAHTHADMMWVEPVMKSRIISVEQVRELNARINQTSFVGGWKVCVIVSADRMLGPAANALLKTLEEPPGRSAFFLLTSQPQALLPTILSRCQRLAVGGLGMRLEVPLLERVDRILEKATVGPGSQTERTVAALIAAAELNTVIKELKDRASAEVEDDGAEAGDDAGNGGFSGPETGKDVRDARVGARYREMRSDLARFANEWFRDLLVLAGAGPDAALLDESRRSRLTAGARRVGRAGALRNMRAIDEMTGLFETNMLELVVMENALLRMSAGEAEPGRAAATAGKR